MRARVAVVFATALVVALALFRAPAAFAQERDPNEGEPKHEIRELKNRLHHTDDPSKQNHLESKIEALQGVRTGKFPGGTVIWNWR